MKIKLLTVITLALLMLACGSSPKSPERKKQGRYVPHSTKKRKKNKRANVDQSRKVDTMLFCLNNEIRLNG